MELDTAKDKQDDLCNKLEGRLKRCASLVKRRQLMVQINAVTFGPRILPQRDDGYYICNISTLEEVLQTFADWDHPEYFLPALSELHSVVDIRKSSKKRELWNDSTRGTKLQELENRIATLDNNQVEAVVETVDGVQRIRGLAGSGKTMVLALKATYLHLQHPDWNILVTYSTRSLKNMFRTQKRNLIGVKSRSCMPGVPMSIIKGCIMIFAWITDRVFQLPRSS